MDNWLAVAIFISTLLLIEGVYFALRSLRNPEKKRVRRRLGVLNFQLPEDGGSSLERQVLASQVPWLNRLLLKLRWTSSLSLLLEQAGLQRPLGFYLLLTLVLFGAGFLVGSWMISQFLLQLIPAFLLGLLPTLFVLGRRRRRMHKFERQLPEALDLMARALKSGHAFTGGIKMVADEMDDPIGTEFDKTLAEINFGVEVPEALKNFSRRVNCPDLRFFVISIIIQRETGGNLAEILENLAYLIRERFKLNGRVRVLSAEGKFSALVLIGLPFLVAGVLTFINPDYIRLLVTDPIGHFMIGFAALMMALGVIVIKSLVAIKV
jgi:tight adherence protein B